MGLKHQVRANNLSISKVCFSFVCSTSFYLGIPTILIMFYQTPANLLVSFFALKHASALPSGPISVPQSTNVLSLLTRGVPANTIAGTGGCDNDPSYAQGTSRWKDGDGVSLGHDCDNGLWNGDAFWHCW